jgi:hypothetical protein
MRNVKSKVSENEILHDERRIDTYERGVEVVTKMSEYRNPNSATDRDFDKTRG